MVKGCREWHMSGNIPLKRVACVFFVLFCIELERLSAVGSAFFRCARDEDVGLDRRGSRIAAGNKSTSLARVFGAGLLVNKRTRGEQRASSPLELTSGPALLESDEQGRGQACEQGC
jgi:hypothetical protein